MRRSLLPLLAALGACASVPPADLALMDRMVWTGEGFAPRDLYVRDGLIVEAARVAEGTVVLGGDGRFVVPGYADLHQHVTNPTEGSSDGFLDLGTYYLWNPNSMLRFAGPEADAFFARADTVDVMDAHAGLTEPNSHPEPLYTEVLARYVYPDIPKADFAGDAFLYARTRAEAEAASDRLASAGADMVKLYLLGSEDYAADGSADTGLNPALVPVIVEAAHARGLLAVAHVETAHDLGVAAEAGVDVAMHLPGYAAVGADEDRHRVTPVLAARVAGAGMKVVPTYWLANANADALDEAARTRTARVQGANLRALADAGVPILAGTDGNAPALMAELTRWVETGGLTEREALTAFLNTAREAFGDQGLGCLDPGCRADFLGLADDPRADLGALTRIVTRVKGGDVLRTPEGPDEAP